MPRKKPRLTRERRMTKGKGKHLEKELSNISVSCLRLKALPIMNIKLKLEKAVRNDIYDYLTK